ncbi:BLOC-2 complex member HPS6 [Alligator mississippiensis]|uniref:BLOC-2 complex member HPS6 n=1 Tax=Alligator mississippiensis TaxID=8496 RepID=UPI0028779309|nr:BLOC-2 complex member HPS6 [Alligator mississippiensis]
MRRGGALRPVWELSAAGPGRRLRALLGGGGGAVRGSPDGRHLVLRPAAPEPAVLALSLALWRGGAEGAGEHAWRAGAEGDGAVAGVAFVGTPWALAVVWERGRAELWRPVPAVGWRLLQSLELCQGARARVVSVGSQGAGLVWCEERPPMDAPAAPARAALRYCVCTRALEVAEQGARLGPVRIVLHNCPCYRILASPRHVFLLPAPDAHAGAAKLLLVWCPQESRLALVAPARGLLRSHPLPPAGELDFKKLVAGCAGLLPALDPLDIHTCALSDSGDLLLLSPRGAVDLLQPNGAQRCVFDLGGSALAPGDPAQLHARGGTLACALAGLLYLVDLGSGRLLDKMVLSTKEVHFLEDEEELQLLMPTGIYSYVPRGAEPGGRPEPPLSELVFQEACKYYQRRSLSSAPLTVEKLRKGGMFQAPIALAAILHHGLRPQHEPPHGLPGPHAKLLSALSLELQSYRSLEVLKACVVGAPEGEVDSYCEELVEQELTRLLHSELDPDNLAYLNTIFRSFPRAAWKAVRASLQLRQGTDGLLVARATPDIWKKVLGGPVVREVEGGCNGVLPLFELICGSLHRYKPAWLPRFVALTQQYAGTAWPYGSQDGPEGRVPLYKRALAVLTRRAGAAGDEDLEIDLLLCSARPKAVLQAVQLLVRLRHWSRVLEAARRFCPRSPLLNKEIFATLLAEVAQHRELDPHLGALWDLCPPDLAATDILAIVLQHLPSPVVGEPAPFAAAPGTPLTVGLLKPLLQRVAQCPRAQDELYANALQSPGIPPPTPPRERRAGAKLAPRTATLGLDQGGAV